jgi:thiol-disulfide isomerase/thioredoxin
MSKIFITGLLFCVTILFLPSLLCAEQAPKFFLSNLDGARFYSKKNPNIIISFFFIDCVPCRKEIPLLYKLINQETLDTSLLFVDPLKDDTSHGIKALAQKLKVPTTFFYRDALGIMAEKYFKGTPVFPLIVGIKNRSIIFRLHDLKKSSRKKIINSFKQ